MSSGDHVPALFNFPVQARVARVVPKSKIYEHGPVNSALRDKFVGQVEQITWAYKLAPETINLPARGGVAEIQVFDITLKAAELDEDVLRAIDRAIPLPIIFQLHHEQRTRMVAAFKRPSEADASKWVIDGYFAGGWLPTDGPRQALPVALDLQGLYEQLLRSLLPSPARPGESLAEQLQRLNRLRSLHSERAKLDARLHKEKQFNRKVALNAQLREIQNEIADLSA
ncbi:TPA: DUF4391 domain-containing protein [Pseudomonas aeruginosa]|uniref:DUF4391 domain-containing protein n=1 Tax=Pseudomonas aeruginosa TaxID=287 RepID=UPI000997B13C|nr:DUF4391 domain-containing protein [Pseudomonas aeruginosa]OSC91860.1 methyl-accepting chemotaxis protein [Pseudomonas aeruginosa]RPO16637.1 DUF4391 domain-containing protein [Pseudomonas aeruginosa]RUE80777.1 DUF4391 domain-containing protein [Pseudomonas aeruginosa]HBP1800606.1 DUF4391 domain-containing protein [Pseudomonas aeruginosa]HCG1579332.1 DUF4391 domain-containing protein [Pseudomonas aeruginosa]